MGGGSSDGYAFPKEYVIFKVDNAGKKLWYTYSKQVGMWTDDLCIAARFARADAQVTAACLEDRPYYETYDEALKIDHEKRLGQNYYNPRPNWESYVFNFDRNPI